MNVTVQFFDGCPNWHQVDERLRTALADCGLTGVEVRYEVVDTPERAESIGFRGSPTLLINGVDPFADPTGCVGLSCRLFTTDEGLAGSPTVAQIVMALCSPTDV